LGGFYFRQSDCRELDGWTAPKESHIIPDSTHAGLIEKNHSGSFPYAFCMRRKVAFSNPVKKWGIGITITVANSSYWAQQELIEHCTGKYGGGFAGIPNR
jgi:hypothetical protein